jgi:hypothetical protein
MKILLTTLLIALMIVPALSQSQTTAVGGSFGSEWIKANGNKEIYSEPTSFQAWGGVPLGNMMENGKLVSTGNDGTTLLIFPAFPDTPGKPELILANKSMTAGSFASRLNKNDMNSPYLSMDPFTIAQQTNKAVLI